MQAVKWITLVGLLALANGQDEFPTNPDTQNYQFRYFVRDESTGDVKSQEEKKIGDTVNGHYTVGEPNGDLRVVTYTADEGGFRANVKYEEGGSPISDKSSSQTNAKSGVDFQWLPANPDDIEQMAKQEEGGEENEETTSESSTEGKSTEETTEPSNETEVTSEKSSSEGDESSPEGKESDESKDDDKKSSEEDDKKSSEEDDKKSSEEDDKKSSEEDSDSEKKDESESTKEDSKEKSSEESSSEEKSSSEEDSEKKDDDESEASESAPESEEVPAPTEPNPMYLPVLPPFLNLPSENPASSNERPTIIYASQNFYNPWQWFSNRRLVREEQPPLEDEQAAHYMTGMGYIIVPRPQQ